MCSYCHLQEVTQLFTQFKIISLVEQGHYKFPTYKNTIERTIEYALVKIQLEKMEEKAFIGRVKNI